MIPSLGTLKIGSLLKIGSGLSSLWLLGVPWHPQILADQLTLSHPWEGDYAYQLIMAPSDFQTFLRLFGPKTEREAKILSGDGNIAVHLV